MVSCTSTCVASISWRSGGCIKLLLLTKLYLLSVFFLLLSLPEKCQIRSFFWSVFSRIRSEYGEIRRISPYSVRMRENTDQKKTPYLNTFHVVYLFVSFWHFSPYLLANDLIFFCFFCCVPGLRVAVVA